MSRTVEQFNLVWIEERLDASDAEGHGQLAQALDTPSATGEMLSSVSEHVDLVTNRSVDYLNLLESLGTTMIAMPQTRLLQPNPTAQDNHYSRVQDEHHAICKAIQLQDPQASSAAMRTHLTDTRIRLTHIRL